MFIQQLELLKVAELSEASRRAPFHQPSPPGTHHIHLRMEMVVGLRVRSPDHFGNLFFVNDK